MENKKNLLTGAPAENGTERALFAGAGEMTPVFVLWNRTENEDTKVTKFMGLEERHEIIIYHDTEVEHKDIYGIVSKTFRIRILNKIAKIEETEIVYSRIKEDGVQFTEQKVKNYRVKQIKVIIAIVNLLRKYGRQQNSEYFDSVVLRLEKFLRR
jgi:hypothetical protein